MMEYAVEKYLNELTMNEEDVRKERLYQKYLAKARKNLTEINVPEDKDGSLKKQLLSEYDHFYRFRWTKTGKVIAECDDVISEDFGLPVVLLFSIVTTLLATVADLYFGDWGALMVILVSMPLFTLSLPAYLKVREMISRRRDLRTAAERMAIIELLETREPS